MTIHARTHRLKWGSCTLDLSMQKAPDITINLAKHSQGDFLERFIGFALTVGRFLIICTEIIALGAFIYRFTLDRMLVDLHDTIVQQQAIVKLLHDNEVVFRNIQTRLHVAAALIQHTNTLPSYTTDVAAFAPSDMNIHTIDVATDAIRIGATVQSVDSLTLFINKLKAYAPIASVSIDRIDNQTETAMITVSITALFKQPKGVAVGNLPANAGGAL